MHTRANIIYTFLRSLFHVSFVYVFSVQTAVTNIFFVIFVILIYEGHCFLGCGDKV